MQPTGTGTSNRFEGRLVALRDHRALGRPVRFYFQRREQLLYLVIGGWNTVFGYGVWALLQALLGDRLHYLVIVLIAWPIAVLNAYLGYRLVVFRSRDRVRGELPRFLTVYIATLVANLILLPLALATLPINVYVAQALFAILIVIWSYLAHKYYSFRGSQPRDADVAAIYDPPAILKD